MPEIYSGTDKPDKRPWIDEPLSKDQTRPGETVGNTLGDRWQCYLHAEAVVESSDIGLETDTLTAKPQSGRDKQPIGCGEW